MIHNYEYKQNINLMWSDWIRDPSDIHILIIICLAVNNYCLLFRKWNGIVCLYQPNRSYFVWCVCVCVCDVQSIYFCDVPNAKLKLNFWHFVCAVCPQKRILMLIFYDYGFNCSIHSFIFIVLVAVPIFVNFLIIIPFCILRNCVRCVLNVILIESERER